LFALLGKREVVPMKKNAIIALVAVAGAAGLANATLFFESEPNNTLLTADDVGSYDRPGDAFAVDAASAVAAGTWTGSASR
jgi:hypothetical protein